MLPPPLTIGEAHVADIVVKLKETIWKSKSIMKGAVNALFLCGYIPFKKCPIRFLHIFRFILE